MHKAEKILRVSISVGFSMIKNNHTDLMQHFTQADSAMYAHKQKHKQQLAEFQQVMSS